MSTLLVAHSGGHLKQLHRLVPRIPQLNRDLTWVTSPGELSAWLLEGQSVIEVERLESRDYRGVAKHAWLAARIVRRRRFSRVISTGASLALAILPVARARGIPCHYIESVARSAGPSATGRVLRWVPGVRLYSQYQSWATGPWRYAGSVFDEFELEPDPGVDRPMSRVVVTLGTSTRYGFRRLVERLAVVLPRDAEILWQTGVTDVSGLNIAARVNVPGDELAAAIRHADLVVAHAGVGSALSALEAGRVPVLVPRRKQYGENVDDHQDLIAAELARRGLAVAAHPETLSLTDLTTAARRGIRLLAEPPPLRLVEQ